MKSLIKNISRISEVNKMPKWERRQTYKNKPFWVWMEYEIHKVWSDGTTTYNLIHIDFPDEKQPFNWLASAKLAADIRRKELKCL
jgi:hypothetical protein